MSHCHWHGGARLTRGCHSITPTNVSRRRQAFEQSLHLFQQNCSVGSRGGSASFGLLHPRKRISKRGWWSGKRTIAVLLDKRVTGNAGTMFVPKRKVL